MGNIAGDSVKFRDLIIEEGGIENLIWLIAKIENIYSFKHCIWAISNIVRGFPLVEVNLSFKLIPLFGKVIKETDDFEILNDSMWAFSFLSGYLIF